MGDLSMILVLLGVEGGQSFVLVNIHSLVLTVGMGKSLPGGGSRSRVPCLFYSYLWSYSCHSHSSICSSSHCSMQLLSF